MIQGCKNFCLSLKSADAIGILRELSRQNLDRDFMLSFKSRAIYLRMDSLALQHLSTA